MTTKIKKIAAPAAPAKQDEVEPAYIEARINGHEINREILRLSVPDGSGGWMLARMRVPKRLAHCFKRNSMVRVRQTADPAIYEPFPTIL